MLFARAKLNRVSDSHVSFGCRVLLRILSSLDSTFPYLSLPFELFRLLLVLLARLPKDRFPRSLFFLRVFSIELVEESMCVYIEKTLSVAS